jgi:thioesterase domain-containing protein
MPTGLFMGCTCAREVDLLTADMPEKQLAALSSVPQLASRYLKQIRTLQPEGPYFLAGESFGVAGDHIGILKDPNVQAIAAKLIACLERAEIAATFRG